MWVCVYELHCPPHGHRETLCVCVCGGGGCVYELHRLPHGHRETLCVCVCVCVCGVRGGDGGRHPHIIREFLWE